VSTQGQCSGCWRTRKLTKAGNVYKHHEALYSSSGKRWVDWCSGGGAKPLRVTQPKNGVPK
jgi:hypothetical protein